MSTRARKSENKADINDVAYSMMIVNDYMWRITHFFINIILKIRLQYLHFDKPTKCDE